MKKKKTKNYFMFRITVDNAAAQTLTKEARRWATKIAREINTYNESKRKLKAYQHMRESGQKVYLYHLKSVFILQNANIFFFFF